MSKTLLDFPRYQKQIIAALVDSVSLPLTFCVAVWLRFDSFNMTVLQPYVWLIALIPFISVPIFMRLGLYRAVIRFIDHQIVHVVLVGVTLSVAILVLSAAFATHMIGLSRGVFGIYWVCAVMYVAFSRFMARAYVVYAHRIIGSGKTKVAIYGAGSAGNQLASALIGASSFEPVAFIDDKKELAGATIGGIKVYQLERLPYLIAEKGVKEVLLAMPTLSRARQKAILDRLEPFKVKIKATPSIASLVSGEFRLQDIRDIEIEDLLGRDAVEPDPTLISLCITGKTVMVTGAGGSIGSELCRQILRQLPSRLILLDNSEYALYQIEQELQIARQDHAIEADVIPFLGSVLEQEKCTRIMKTFAVDTVYHAAAYKHVPLVEHNPVEGVRNNVFGTLKIVQAALAAKVKTLVLISTDKAVRPTNVMGATKRLAEMILQAYARSQHDTRFSIVRFGNVLGSSGSVVPLFRKQIMAGGPITLTHPEIMRYFMTIPEAAQLVLQAGAMGEGGDVFVLDMGEPVKIMDLARRMVHLSGLEIKGESDAADAIQIEHVGLRPGEKLYEELLIGDNVEGTGHPLIMRAQESELAWPVLQELLQQLEAACERYDCEDLRKWLLKAVTEYAPQCGIEDHIWRESNGSSVVALHDLVQRLPVSIKHRSH